MDAVCEECGDAGIRKLLLRCSKCKSAARHRYCLDAIIFDSVVDWSCSGCIPKHNEAIKSLEDASNEVQLSNTQLGCPMINEPNVDNEKVTKARRPRTIRPRRKRNYHVDDSTKHFPSGDASNLGQCGSKSQEERDSMHAISAQFCSGDAIDSSEVFVGDIPNHYDCEKEGEDRNGHLTCAVESSDGSSEQPLNHASEFEPNNLQKAMDGSRLTSKSAECTHLSNGRSCCFPSAKCVEDLVPRGRKGDIFSLTNDVEGSLPMIGDKPCPTSASVEQAVGLSVNREKPEPLKAVTVFEKSVVASKFAPNCSKRIQGSELKTGSADVLSPLMQHLDSWPTVPMQSSPSNELEDVAVQESSAERTRCLVDEQTNAPTMETLKVSKPSMENECLDSNEDNSDKANRGSDEVLLSTKAKKMPRQMCGDRETINCYNKNGISEPEPAKGDRDARNLQRSAEKPSYLGVKKMFLNRVLQGEGINSELLPSKFVGPCESTKINPRKRKQSESYNPDGTRYQKVARSKDGRLAPAASLRDSQNMPGEDNVSNDKVIGHSTKGKHKKLDKSWLANKASRDPRKREMVTRDLHRSSVDKSRAYSENIDLTLQESSYSLNNPQSSCEPKKRRRLYDLNSRSCDNDRHLRKKRKCTQNAAKNQRRCLKKGKEASGSGNLNHRHSKNYKRSTDANKDENASVRNLDFGCAKSVVAQLASQTVVKEGNCGLSRMPLISECIDMQHLDKPYWTGIMEIDKNYVPLAAHLSTKAGKKVKEHSRSLPPILKVTEFSTSKTCPKHLEAPIPPADSIDLYFFCGDTRPNKELDQLVKHVADSGIIIEAIVGLAKLCLYPSFVLAEENQTFQGKPYLWGVFKPRKDEIKRLAPAEQDCSAHVTEEEHVQEQNVLDQQDKVQSDPLDQVTHPENQPLLDANEVGKETLSGNGLSLVDMRAVVSANISPADHVQPCSNPEAPPLKICGFVMSRTPRSAELIQEMQKEGALLFAVQQVMTEPGSVV
ncbi:uncharacterized protein LOC124703343 isoform X4 [Lolium rigidum]|uniref:uncharacterized protein LOC124703343 isoform X3 n=1 Tax=Lolium rigidum TaxID=89674 RepID=UPI001F5D22A2|nr:uncharacterized protein LOC124703343 isoform X3 [Lolium rigidum]XP_047091519.1 uncharacterized protein LOC124703343 isoform X4 [Lolium rigidum]